MMSSPRSLRLLDVASGLALLAALALYLWPVRVSVASVSALSNASPTVAATPVTPNDNEANTVVAENILSSSRHVPSVRYTSPELLPAPDYSVGLFAASASADSAKTSADDPDAVPSLYGIVNSDGAWRALLRLAESDASPKLLSEGDRRGSYVVVTIRPNAVVVSGPSGQRTLRLTRSVRDSTGKSL